MLSPAVRERDYTIKQSMCPRCRGNLQTRFHPNYMFSPEEILPKSVAVCGECGYSYDPSTGLVLNVGDPSKAMRPEGSTESRPSTPGPGTPSRG